MLNESRYPVLFWLILVAYCLLFAPYGFDDTDGGYVIGYAWRVLNGETPYIELIKTKPPLSAYIHAFWLWLTPDKYQILITRCIAIFNIGFYSLLIASAIEKKAPSLLIGQSKWLWAIIFFIFNNHNFPPMPWYTTDGILLSSIGIFFLSSTKLTHCNIVVGSLFFILSTQTKQSFYLMPVFAGVFILLDQGLKKALLFGIFSAFWLLSYILSLKLFGNLEGFIQWTFGITKPQDFLNAGIIAYFDIDYRIPILSAIVTFIYGFIQIRKGKSDVKLIFAHCFIIWSIFTLILYLILRIYLQWKHPDLFQIPANYGQFLFIISALICTWGLTQREWKKYIYLLLLLSLSWSCSISFGYLNPVLFSAPLILIPIYHLKFIQIKPVRWQLVQLIAVVTGIITFSINYIGVFREGNRYNCTYDLGELFEKLAGIKTNNHTYERIKELKSLHEKYGDNFKTLPHENLSNYLTNTISPLQADWLFNLDVNFNNTPFINNLTNKNPVVFLDRSTINHTVKVGNTDNNYCGPCDYVIQNWVLIERGQFFDVYKSSFK